MKPILIVSLYMTGKYKRNFAKLVERVKEAGGNASVTDYTALPSATWEETNSSFGGVVLSGTEALYTRTADRNQFATLIQFLPKITIPVLGICGGHQVLALAYGGKVTRTSDLIQGFRTVTLEDKDTLLAGLPHRIKVMQSHREEVKQLPPNFIRIATSADIENEGMKHESRPLYGVQFHPEKWNEENTAGKRVLENFVERIATQ